jgi:hypothetical protein
MPRTPAAGVNTSAIMTLSQRLSSGEVLAKYLQRRGITGPMPTALRFVPTMTYFRDGNRANHPSMIGLLKRPNRLAASPQAISIYPPRR